MGSKVYNTDCPYHDDCAYRKTCPPGTVLMNERDIGDDDSVECQVNHSIWVSSNGHVKTTLISKFHGNWQVEPV